MCDGRIVERAATEVIFTKPQHPYTRALLGAIPVLNPRDRRERSFLNREQINMAIPKFRASDLEEQAQPSAYPQLVVASPGHYVEAIVS